MRLRKYRLFIMFTFLGIFTAKMMISGAPVFFSNFDKSLMNAVIMQLENENHGDDTGKNAKFGDQKLMFQRLDMQYAPVLTMQGIKNSFIDHFRRYVDPYHPSVPTPPPNFS